MRWLFALAACGACSSGTMSAGAWDEVESSPVACIAHVEHEDRLGPTQCADALIAYLSAHPEERIASVVPINTNAVGGAVETSSLIVMHTHGNGPWLRARDLTLGTLVCDERASATSPLRRCPDALLDEYTKNRRAYVVWFPITGTVQTIAFLYHASE